LEKRADRRALMDELGQFHGLCFDYFKAVESDDMEVNRLNQSWNLYGFPGIKACYLSHYHIYESIIKNGYSKSLILEDDVDMELDLFDIMSNIHLILPNDWEILYLGHCHEWIDDTKILVSGLSTNHKLHTAVHPQCTHAYAITASAAKKLLEILDIDHTYADAAIDVELADLILDKKFIAYGVHPQIITQWKAKDDMSDTVPEPDAVDKIYTLTNSTLEILGF
ncbi:9774_t:CDS:1, partial [Racocetra fulgida]